MRIVSKFSLPGMGGKENSMTSEKHSRKAPDYKEIIHVIQLYCEGWKGDPNKFREAFHNDAWIFFTDSNGQLQKYLLNDCFDGWANTNWEIEPRIISLNQTGDIANVIMEFKNISNPSATFVDSHNLIKIGGVWKITNKTATHISRANLGKT
jgi:hypothetical protein